MSDKTPPTLLEKIVSRLEILKNNIIIMSTSGGPDSMVLLDILRSFLGENASNKIIVAHIHHGLRESAERDLEIVKNYCEKYSLIFEYQRFEIKKLSRETKTTIEECARNERINYLESVRIAHQAKYIITAHHADDQAETLLYRITKGTSITGLMGIPEFSGYYFRPLLSIKKKELLEYAKQKGIEYGLDETNDDSSIPRNRIRHRVLPELQIINSEVNVALQRLSLSAEELREGFDIFFQEVSQKKEFNYDWYHSLPLGFQHECLRCLYSVSNRSTHGFSRGLLEELDHFLSTRNGGKKEFGKYWLTKKQSTIYLT